MFYPLSLHDRPRAAALGLLGLGTLCTHCERAQSLGTIETVDTPSELPSDGASQVVDPPAGTSSTAAAAEPDASVGSAGVAAPPSAAQIVTALSDPDARDTDPTFTSDLLELYFTSDRSGSLDLWRSTRATPDSPWGTPTPVPELNSLEREENPHISGDGLVIWFHTTRETLPGSIWRATRATRDEPWSLPEQVPELSPGTGG